MKLNDLSLLQKGLIIIGIPLMCQLAFAMVITGALGQSYKDAAVARWRREAAERTDNMFRLCVEAATTVVSYGMTKDKSLARRYDEVTDEIVACRRSLREIAGTNQNAVKLLKKSDRTIDYSLHLLDKIKEELDCGAKNPLSFMSLFQRHAAVAKIVTLLNEIQKSAAANEYQMEKLDRQKHEREHKIVIAALGLAVAGNIAVAIATALFFGKQINDRLLLISDNSKRLTSGEQLHSQQEGSDEVSILDQRFHKMVAALEAAATREQELINNSADVICALDNNRKFLFANDAVTRHWGKSPAQLIGCSLDDLIPSSEREKAAEFFHRLESADAAPTRPLVLTLVTDGGAGVDTSWACYWSEFDQRFFCVVHDVTAQKEQERMKARFISMISTRLNEPLQDIEQKLLQIERGSKSTIKPRGATALKNGISAASRIVQLVDELLDLEKMEGGVLTLQLEQCSAQSIIDAAIASIQSYAEFKNLKVRFVSRPTAMLNADQKRLTQVLVNLLSNAIKYSPEGGTIELNAAIESGAIVFEVLDEGPGIPELALTKLFARFMRLDRAEDKNTVGTGLGLAICKIIVEQHGGSIGVNNRENGGSRFWFSIPT